MPITQSGDGFVNDVKNLLHTNMVRALDMIARSARSRAVWSSKIRRAIKVGKVKQQGEQVFGYIEVDRTIAPEARAFEYGSGIHATRGKVGKYPIAPLNSPYMSFPGTNAWSGQQIIVPPMGGGIVQHPGVAQRPFLNPAVQENRDKIKAILGSDFKQAVSKAIRFSWSQDR